MKVVLLWVLASGIAFLPVSAVADWSDDFDSYPTGSGLHGQGGWKGWDGDPTWDAIVTDVQSRSAPNSVEITENSDMVHEYDGYTSGVWVYTAWVYVPTSFSGTSYFILLNTYHDFGPYNWSCQISFNSDGQFVLSDFDGATLPLITGQWVELRVVIDLDADVQTFYYGGQMLYEKSWTDGVSGDGAVNIGAVDLFANGASPIYYDDMSLGPEAPPPTAVNPTTWGGIKNIYNR